MKIRYYLAALMVTLAACGPSVPYVPVQQQAVYNPCDQQTYDPGMCQQAINNRGYYNGGVFIAMTYPHPYSYYNQSYVVYHSHGGVVRTAPSGYYSRSYVAPRTTTQSGGYTGARTTYQSRPSYTAPRTTYSSPSYSAPRSSSSSRTTYSSGSSSRRR